MFLATYWLSYWDSPTGLQARERSMRSRRHKWAILTLCGCFKPRQPLEQQAWFLTVRREAVVWQREGETYEFDARAWQQ
jgi:hypothetical protein